MTIKKEKTNKIKAVEASSQMYFALDKSVLIFFGIMLVGLSFTSGYLFSQSKKTTASAELTNLNQPNQQAQPQAANAGPQINFDKVPAVDGNDHILGKKDAKVVLVEYSDFQCPFCQRIHTTLQQLKKEYGDKIAWVYRHYPLGFHDQAQIIAEGSECAAELKGNDGFWKYTDAIFEKMPNVKGADLPDLAASVGIDKNKFKKCLDSGKYKDKVADQFKKGSEAGVTGTPGTFVIAKNGKKEFINGALPVEEIKTYIENALK